MPCKIMKQKIAEENTHCEELLPPSQSDGSGVGVNYATEYIKSLNVALEDGRKIVCKRKGLRIMFSVGESKGDALMDKRKSGADSQKILRDALQKAAKDAGCELSFDAGGIYLADSL